MRNKKFTLIELLLVIAVIAILSSMLLPAIHKARRDVLKAACLSNLHQVGISVLCYSNNNKDNIQLGSGDNYPGETYLSQKQLFWRLQETGYLKMGRSTTCSESPPATISLACYGTRFYDGKKSKLGNYWIAGCKTRAEGGPYPFIVSWNGASLPYLIHNRKSNMLFNDGSALPCGPLDLKNLKDNQGGGFGAGFSSAYFGNPGDAPELIDF